MSQSPIKAPTTSQTAAYLAATDRNRELLEQGKSYSGRERNCLYLNTGGPRFANVSAVSGLDFDDDCRAVAPVDWDHDGDLDFWTANRTGPRLRLLRNEITGRHFIAVKLRGTRCNRDAIGARIELHRPNDQRKIIQTVRAGEGYASQRGKWQIFGLGEAADDVAMTVRWPDGSSDRYENLAVDKHYNIVQGDAAPTVWTRPQPADGLTPKTLDHPKPTNEARVVLSSRVPMISTELQSFGGKKVLISGTTDGPILLNIWASWCAPCTKELQEFTDHLADIDRAGLRIVAVSIDGIDPAQNTTRADAQTMLRKMQFPFRSATIDEATLNKLRFFQNQLFVRDAPFPVPMSFLIDQRGYLAVIYRGPVEVKQLLDDVRNINQPAFELRHRAVPMTGRWLLPPLPANVSELAKVLQQAGLLGDAIRMLDHYIRTTPPPDKGDTDAMRSYSEALTNCGAALLQQGSYEQAERFLRLATTAMPTNMLAYQNLANLHLRQEQYSKAAAIYKKALAIQPDSAELHNDLGNLLDYMKQPDSAAEHYRAAIKADPTYPNAHSQLGIYLDHLGQLDQAIASFRKAVELNPDHLQFHNNLTTALLKAGRREEAQDVVEKAVARARAQGLESTAREIAETFRANIPASQPAAP